MPDPILDAMKWAIDNLHTGAQGTDLQERFRQDADLDLVKFREDYLRLKKLSDSVETESKPGDVDEGTRRALEAGEAFLKAHGVEPPPDSG